ncbi:MAG: hypothetical protein O6929_10680 [candidate division NC10 bacterium]|nr:hypothetical protein [candidate division NC10 bacterium]
MALGLAHNGSGRSKRHFSLCLLAVGIFLTACAGAHIRNGTYINETKGFGVQLPSRAWTVETGEETDLILLHESRQAGMVVNATCGEIPPDRPLNIVSRHLFFGIQAKEVLQQDGRTAVQGEGLEVVLRGELGGRELQLHGYTLRGPDCVYDLVLFAPPEVYSEVNWEFEALVRGFHMLPEGT